MYISRLLLNFLPIAFCTSEPWWFSKKTHECATIEDSARFFAVPTDGTTSLVAILSAGLIGSSEATSTSWGFTTDNKVRLAREWDAASVSCLHMGNYTLHYNMLSVQTIYILHASEHLVGSSSNWAALRSVAVVIARGLGLHKLGPHPDDDRILELDPEQKQAFIEREIGRRLWHTLALHDWYVLSHVFSPS